MSNNHYVPKLVLKKFKNKICLYNVNTGEYRENVNVDDAYSEENLYDDETETKLNRLIESQFGSLLANKILTSDGTVVLTREQLYVVKKFLLISLLRCRDMADNAAFEKNRSIAREMFGFAECEIEGETPREYWRRTLNVILDTNGTPEEILKHKDRTGVAYRWAYLVKHAYLAFWDAAQGEEFVITDRGMTSENEKGWDGVYRHNVKKTGYMREVLERVKSSKLIGAGELELEVYDDLIAQCNFSENFMMFPISSKRMIVLISPFFKKVHRYAGIGVVSPPLEELTCMPNPKLFEPNRTSYKYKQTSRRIKEHRDDRYLYDVKKLSSQELWYCNSLFLDRIYEYLGFSSLDQVAMSVLSYKVINEWPYVPRVKYEPLFKVISERYGDSAICEILDLLRCEWRRIMS